MSIIILPVLMLFTIQAIDAYGSSTCFDNSSNGLISEMKNCRSYFHYATLFSDLSRNMTSSSDLFEDNSTEMQLQDNIESQDNVKSNTEVDGFQEGDASDTDQPSSPSSSPSSDLFEDNNENTQLQDNVENNDTEIDQQDEITELEGNNDNNTIFG
jgi:hypothetical protein